MATRRRKIARSAVRRVKRRESKNAKLRSLRSRKHSSKRMNMRKMNGGADPDDFFSVYSVELYREVVAERNRSFAEAIKEQEILYTGALFYNHKTKKFHLFTALSSKVIKNLLGVAVSLSPSYIKVIKHLLGVDETDIFQPKPLDLQPNDDYYGGIDYYNEFDGNKWRTLYCHFVTKKKLDGFRRIDVEEIEYDIDEINIPPANRGTPIKLENNEGDKTVDVGGNEKLTFSRVVTDDEAKKTYQIKSSSIFVRNETTIKNAVAIATKVFSIIRNIQRNKKKAINEQIAAAKKKYDESPEVIEEAKRFWEAQKKRDEEERLLEQKKYDDSQKNIQIEWEKYKLKKAAEEAAKEAAAKEAAAKEAAATAAAT